MKVLIAIDSFKGSLSSIEASNAISEGIHAVDKNTEVSVVPLADGGEGTVDALVHATGGRLVDVEVTGPLGEKIMASYGVLGGNKTVVVEVAAACGLPLVPLEQRNPGVTTTYGVGELICDALSKGYRDFVIGLGGSATNDGGVGMLQALGFSFLDKNKQEIGFGGYALREIEYIDTSRRRPELSACTFKVACDVNNPLCGENGASAIYGPQKGATPEMVRELDFCLRHYGEVAKRECNREIAELAGAGAAGGLGAAFAGFLDAKLLSGVDLLLDTVNIEAQLQAVNFVITGEGRLDGQTSMGKAPMGVAKRAAKFNIPVIALAGGVTSQATKLNSLGIDAYFSILQEPMTLQEAMNANVAYENLRNTAEQVFRLITRMRG